jgi:hypothetical protein
LFYSDKFRAITAEKTKGRSVNEKDTLEDMKKTYKEISDTHSSSFQWPSAVRLAHIAPVQWLIHLSSLSLPP